MTGILTFKTLAEALQAGYSVFDRTESGYIVRIRTARGWAMRRIGSRGPLFVGSGKSALREELDGGASVVGMLDLPAGSRQRAAEVPLFGRIARLPVGLAQLAVDGKEVMRRTAHREDLFPTASPTVPAHTPSAPKGARRQREARLRQTARWIIFVSPIIISECLM